MIELRAYQKSGARAIYDFGGRALLADQMGLGKTATVLYWKVKTRTRPLIVVCPASAKYVWEDEAQRHFGLSSDVLEGRKPPRKGTRTHAEVIIINYDVLSKWVPYLRRLKPQGICIDEAHHIKNRKSQRCQAVQALCEGVPHVIVTSGTPLTNRPAELWPALNILFPKTFESFFRFAWAYCKPKRLPWGWVYSGSKNLGHLHKRLKRMCMIRRLKEDVLTELPSKVRKMVPLSLQHRKEYEEATNDFLGWLRKQSASKAQRAKKSEALVKVGYLLRLCAKLKVPYIYDWIDEFLEQGDEKLIVFTKHRKMIDLLHARYGKMSVIVDGRTKGRQRQLAVRQFQQHPHTRLFLGNVQAAGSAITLTAASTVVFTDLPWTPGELAQAEDRPHRIGQKKTVFIYYLVARNTVEVKLCQLLQEKQKILDEVLDGGRTALDLDIFNELLGSLKLK